MMNLNEECLLQFLQNEASSGATQEQRGSAVDGPLGKGIAPILRRNPHASLPSFLTVGMSVQASTHPLVHPKAP